MPDRTEGSSPAPLSAQDDTELRELLAAPAAERRHRAAVLNDTAPTQGRRVTRLLALLDEVGFLDDPDDESGDAAGAAGRIDGYRLVRVLGSGGMGVVFAAEPEAGGPTVAIKVVHDGLARTPQARERFRREGLAAQRLDHPHLCPVLEVGEDCGVPFLVMPLVAGMSLHRHLEMARRDGAAPLRLPGAAAGDAGALAAILHLIERMADALHAAHEGGLVHRDVKPGNVMVTDAGEPVLLDFGLARLDDEGLGTLTRTGDQLGTPVYMAPEQVAGEPTGAVTDVYALGVVLYECLTLQRPFDGVSRESLFRQILGEEPTDPRRHNRAIDRRLWAVLQTALAKAPGRRYATAAEFADDLRRLQLGEPVRARAPGPLLRAGRFSRRHRVASVAMGGLLLATVLFAVLLVQWGRALASERTARSAEQVARSADESATAPVAALRRALRAVGLQSNRDTRSALYRAAVTCRERLRLWHASSAFAAQFSPDGELIATGGDDWVARLHTRSGELVAVLPHDMQVQDCAFSPDGELLATASMDGTAAIWNRRGERVYDLVHGPRFAWGGRPLDELLRDPANTWLARLRWSPDGRRLATAGWNRVVKIWDVESGRQLGPDIAAHRDREGLTVRLAWSPDSTLLATAQAPRWASLSLARDTTSPVFVWRPSDAGHEQVGAFEHPEGVHAVAFAAAGHRLLTACADGQWRLRDLDDLDAPTIARHAGERLHCAVFVGDDRVLTSDLRGRMQLWTTTGDPVPGGLRADDSRTAYVRTRFDGSPAVITTGVDPTVRLLDDQLHGVLQFPGHRQKVWSVGFSPDGRQLATASFDRTVRVWDVWDPELPRLFGSGGAIRSLAVGVDGAVLGLAADGTLSSWDLASGRRREVATIPGRGEHMALAADGRRAAVLSHDNRLHVIDMTTGERAPGFDQPADHDLGAVAFLSDGSLLAGGRAPSLHLYGPAGDGPVSFDDPSGRPVKAMAVAPGTDEIAVGGWGNIVRLLNAAGVIQRSWPVLRRSNQWLHAVSFSHDGARLATGGDDGILTVWQVDQDHGRPERVLRRVGHTERIHAIAWSSDDRLLVTGSTDGTARLWDATAVDPMPVAVLRGHEGPVNDVAFSDDDRFVLTAGSDWAIQAWPTDFDHLRALCERRLRVLDESRHVTDEVLVEALIANDRRFALQQVATRLAKSARDEHAALGLRAAEHAALLIEAEDPELTELLARLRARLGSGR